MDQTFTFRFRAHWALGAEGGCQAKIGDEKSSEIFLPQTRLEGDRAFFMGERTPGGQDSCKLNCLLNTGESSMVLLPVPVIKVEMI